MEYVVTVKFCRVNSVGVVEDSEREGDVSSEDEGSAIHKFLEQFKRNEPNRRKIYSVSIREGNIGDQK